MWFCSLEEDLSDSLVLSAEIVSVMRFVLQYLADSGGEVRLTSMGNFSRKLCEKYQEEFCSWHERGSSVSSEENLPVLYLAHELLLNTGYLDEAGTKAWLTTEGVVAVTKGRWAELFRDTVKAAIDIIDWQDYLREDFRHVHFNIIQNSALFLLYLLEKHPSGTIENLIERFSRAFPAFISAVKGEESVKWMQIIFKILFVESFCVPFGFLEITADREKYRTTELFHQAFRWKTAS